MKLIIDIPEDVRNKIIEIYNSCEELHTRENLYQTIANGKPYEERPQGKWIFDSDFTEFGNPYGTYKCDKCGGHSANKYPFCFWCGAKMDKEADNE